MTRSKEREKREIARLAAWSSGNLEYLLKPCQRLMRQRIFEWDGFKYVIKCSRRLGKTYLLCLLAVEQCLRKPGSQVRYGASTRDALEEMVLPVMESVLRHCPKPFYPHWKSSRNSYTFFNSSRIKLAGVDLHPDRLRGTACDLFLLDEAGFISDLDYFIDSVAMPQFLDPSNNVVKGRRLVMGSSPAKTPAHDFTQIAKEAELAGNYSHFDIYAGGYDEKTIELFKQECGGEDSTTWKREYLALDVVDEESAIIPEWDKDKYEVQITPDKYFQFYLKYESIDIGVRDLTVCLFAYYDFMRAKLRVMREFVISGPKMTTEKVAEGIRAAEEAAFGDHPVHKRVSDVNLLLIQDLSILHGLPFFQTDKGALEEMVNYVRVWVGAGRIEVDPSCKQLIGCLRYGVWNKNKTQFDRSKAYGHFDALASLVYLLRNVDHTVNPIPRTFETNMNDVIFMDEGKDTKVDTFRRAFNLKRKPHVY